MKNNVVFNVKEIYKNSAEDSKKQAVQTIIDNLIKKLFYY